MQRVRRHVILGAAFAVAVSMAGTTASAQDAATPTDAANPYETIEGFFKMPEGRKWGSTSAVDVAPDGKTIWVAERCGANRCVDSKGEPSPLDIVLKFDETGKLVTSFGKGMFVFPHGIHVDREGNVWVTDGSDNLPRRAPGAAADAAPAPMPAKVIGH